MLAQQLATQGMNTGLSMGMTKMRHDPTSGCPESRILLVEQLGIAAREVLLSTTANQGRDGTERRQRQNSKGGSDAE